MTEAPSSRSFHTASARRSSLLLSIAGASWVLFSFDRTDAPWAWGAAGVVVACLCQAALTRSARLRRLSTACAAASLGLLGAELAPTRSPRVVERSEGQLYRPSDDLGYELVPNARVRSTLLREEQRLYDVVYTIGPDGHRRGPARPLEARSAIVFVGDSFTFGVGVDDHEALPAVVGDMLGPRARTLNSGVGGWGPHHILATFESRRVTAALGGARPEIVFYGAIGLHPARASGRILYGDRSPRYVVSADGFARRAGMHEARPAGFLERQLRRSRLFSRLRRPPEWELPAHELDLFAALVRSIRREAEALSSDTLFVVIYWRVGSPHEDEVLRTLRALDVALVDVAEVVPELRSLLIPHDGHPRAEAHARLARHLVDRVILPRLDPPRGGH